VTKGLGLKINFIGRYSKSNARNSTKQLNFLFVKCLTFALETKDGVKDT
jgi:hypothetical protein